MLAGFRVKLTFTRLLTVAFTHERSHVNPQSRRNRPIITRSSISWNNTSIKRGPRCNGHADTPRHGGAHGCQDQPRPRLWQLPQEAPRRVPETRTVSVLLYRYLLSLEHIQTSLFSPDTIYTLSIQPSSAFQKNPSFHPPTAPTRAAHSPNLELRTAPGATGHGELQRSEGANSRLYPGRGSRNCQHKSFG